MIGTSLSHYRITEKLGQGGMGEVYRAEDTNLSRQVAIKVLPDEFAHDAERLARFEREAKLLASLNHPNIASIYGLEQADGKPFLVLELVEGQTLAERLKKGRIPLDETLDVCRQIAEGLEAAHEKGIVHRDLKPANVKVTPEGKVKILDFGLAKAFQGEPSVPDVSKSPTLTEAMTHAGVILGTAAYMSPEQAKGKPVDKRADIWGFGCILYECLTGKRAFQGDTTTETVAAILKSEPDWTALPAETPMTTRSLLRRCLQKEPGHRLHDVADARIEVQDVISPDSEIQPVFVPSAIRWRLLPLIAAGVLLLIAATLTLRNWRLPDRTQLPSRRYAIPLPEPDVDNWRPNLALSPDGTQLAYAAGRSNRPLYLRRLSELDFRPVADTEGAQNPFFSPDGNWIGFFAEGRLKKAPVAGGPVVSLTEKLDSFAAGGFWETEGSILFERSFRGGIVRKNIQFPETALETIFTPDRKNNEMGLIWPQRLPADDLVLLTAFAGNITSMNDARIVVGHLRDRPKRTTLTGGSYGRYLPTGHLVYGYDGRLMAVPLDLENLRIEASAVPVLDQILMNPASGHALFAFSNVGDLVYVPGGMIKSRGTFVLVDRKGIQQLIALSGSQNENQMITSPSLSPDGLRIAVHMAKANDDVHVYDISRETITRVTFEDGDERKPIWTPDGTQLAYTSEPGPTYQMFLKTLDGGGSPRPIFDSQYPRYPCSFAPDGNTLAFVEMHPESGWDIWTGPIRGGGKPKPFLQTEHLESSPAFSPDGRWLAYQSDKSGEMQVYVTRYPDGGDEKQISPDGGTEPTWARSGRELLYLSGRRMMSVEVSFRPAFHAGKPVCLFTTSQSLYLAADMSESSYAVMPDGQRFVFVKNYQINPITQCILIQNWFEELKRLCPTGE